MNTEVKVSGMQVRTKVTSNLLVSPNTTESNFGIQLAQAKDGFLEPVSTVDGKAFFYTSTTNVDASGDAKADTYAEYAVGAFNTNYGTTDAVGYIDYTMYIKATSTVDNSKVALTDCNLIYDGGVISTEKAFRVAVFANVSDDNAEDASEVSTTLATAKSILALSGAENFTSGEAVNSTTGTAAVTYGTAAVIDGDIDAGVTRYYYVVVRLWLEGEDTTCNTNTFADLTEKYQLDLKFEIGNVSGATIIGSVVANHYAFATVASTAAGVTLSSSKLSNGATPSTYVWYNMATGAVVAGSTTDAAPSDAGDYYCIITASDGNIYRTGTVTVE